MIDRWKPPWLGELKFNCDISFEEFIVHVGIVLRNHDGIIKGVWMYHFFFPNRPRCGEELMVQALVLAEELCLGKVCVERDSLGAILALRGMDDQVDWRSKQNLEKGQNILRKHPLSSICFVNRSCNHSAHRLAKWSRQSKFIRRLDLDNLSTIICYDSGDLSVTVLDEVNIDGLYNTHKKKKTSFQKNLKNIYKIFSFSILC